MHTTVTCPSAEITIWRSRLDADILAALAAIYRRMLDVHLPSRTLAEIAGDAVGGEVSSAVSGHTVVLPI